MTEEIIQTENETIEFGKKLAQNFHGGDIVLLYGNLGAGKTTLSKGIARGLGIEKDITSPTFTLMNVYPIALTKNGIKTFAHIDTYRLNDAKELVAIGVEDYLGASDTVTVIEWPEKVEELLEGKKVMKIFLEHDGEGRKIHLENFQF